MYDYLDSLDHRTVYKYFDDHAISYSYYGNGEKSYFHKVISKTNAKGSIIFEQQYTKTEHLHATNYNLFNSNEQQTSNHFEFGENSSFSFNRWYNDEGICVGGSVYKNNFLMDEYHFEHEFDSEENWIKKTVYKNETPFGIVERIIEYYEQGPKYLS